MWFSHRQCALIALQDVKSYLMKEGGQIAVSCLSVLWTVSVPPPLPRFKSFPMFSPEIRCLMQQIPQENEEI